jgi:hypothetical protein
MVVPLGGSNLVLLETNGKPVEVRSSHRAVRVEEIDGTDIRRKLIDTNIAVNQPDVDSLYKEAMLPTSMFWYNKPRFFRVSGNTVPLGFSSAKEKAFSGALVQAFSGRKVEATLRVVVLDTMTVRVAIRNVQVPDGGGGFRFHSRRPCDPQNELTMMNAVWTPQANLAFELVSSEPALVDDRDAGTRAELGKAFGLRDPDTAVFPPEIDPPKLSAFFKKLSNPAAHVNLFVVDRMKGGPSGVMTPLGVGFIASNRYPTTFAHEAGHFLLGHAENGQWLDMGHTYNKDKDEDLRELMRDGGSGWKIPFDMVKTVRTFFERFPVH